MLSALFLLRAPLVFAQLPDNYAAELAQEHLATGLAAMEAGDLKAAQSNLDRVIQILKVNSGLFSAEQLPAVEKLFWALVGAGN